MFYSSICKLSISVSWPFGGFVSPLGSTLAARRPAFQWEAAEPQSNQNSSEELSGAGDGAELAFTARSLAVLALEETLQVYQVSQWI